MGWVSYLEGMPNEARAVAKQPEVSKKLGPQDEGTLDSQFSHFKPGVPTRGCSFLNKPKLS